MRELWPLLVGAGLAFAESGLGLGMVVPGETAVVVLAAPLPQWQLMVALGVCVTLGACAGDHVGYLLGRTAGTGCGPRPWSDGSGSGTTTGPSTC